VEKDGKALLKKEFDLASQLNINGSPTFLANNKYTFGGIDADSIKGNFCKYNAGLKGCDVKLSSDQKVQGSCGQ
jgi:hypothetical protein